jgi:hypothetical protein
MYTIGKGTGYRDEFYSLVAEHVEAQKRPSGVYSRDLEKKLA